MSLALKNGSKSTAVVSCRYDEIAKAKGSSLGRFAWKICGTDRKDWQVMGIEGERRYATFGFENLPYVKNFGKTGRVARDRPDIGHDTKKKKREAEASLSQG